MRFAAVLAFVARAAGRIGAAFRTGATRGTGGASATATAFGAGAIIGGAIAAQPRYYEPAPAQSGINPSHVAWCENRYRSYRAYDNTFQPYNGSRQQCYSPYY